MSLPRRFASSISPNRSPSRPQACSTTSTGIGSPRASQPAGRVRSASVSPSNPAVTTQGLSDAKPRNPKGVLSTASPAAR